MLNEITTAFKILVLARNKSTDSYSSEIKDFANTAMHILKREFALKLEVDFRTLYQFCWFAYRYIIDRTLGNCSFPKMHFSQIRRVVVCGSLGKNAKEYLPFIIKLNMPISYVLWDFSSTEHENYYGIKVSKPNYKSIVTSDDVWVLVENESAKQEIMQELECVGHESIFDFKAVLYNVAMWLFE
jgi:hypothetical protein